MMSNWAAALAPLMNRKTQKVTKLGEKAKPIITDAKRTKLHVNVSLRPNLHISFKI